MTFFKENSIVHENKERQDNLRKIAHMSWIKDNLRKNGKKIILAIIAIFVLWQVVFNGDYWKYVWRDIKRDNVADVMVEMFAGCNVRSSIEELSDEDFSNYWREKINIYGFNYYDVKFIMEHSCPILSDAEIEAPPFVYGSKELIEKSKRVRDYQIKFINREFTALQEDLKNSE